MKLLIVVFILLGFCSAFGAEPIGTKCADKNQVGIRKVKDVVIYRDSNFYSSFPSVIRRPDGEIIVAFRRAPDRRIFGAKGNRHVDPNSYLVKVCSKDAVNWTSEPELIYAHAFGGSQDPCLLQLEDGTLLCSSYGWARLSEEEKGALTMPFAESGGFVFLGGYLVRSEDGGKIWEGPIYPPHVAPESNYSPLGKPLPAYNRGALCEGKNGQIYWVVAAHDNHVSRKTSTHLLVSYDKGFSWEYMSSVATDEKASFNEISIYETPKGD